MLEVVVAAIPAAIWLYLLFARGSFWRTAERDDALGGGVPAAWPDVTAVVPARNEADVIGSCLASLLTQSYPGRRAIVLVDDESSDGTADVARAAARNAGAPGPPTRP